MRHSTARTHLYDYLNDGLSADVREEVRLHLADCKRCALDAERMASVLRACPVPPGRPSGSRPEEYWKVLADSIERSTRPAEQPASRPRPFLFQPRRPLWVIRPALAAAVVLIALLVIVSRERPPLSVAPESASTEAYPDPSTREDITRYLGRSRALLIGLSNAAPGDEQAIDLSREREVSRALLDEARRLRALSLDPQSAEVVGDLERIMIEVANSKEDPPDIEMIRQGIRRQNLLFKVRMTEQTLRSGPFVRVSGR